MRLIAKSIDPDEVCPVLPFPATDPRIADRLILEHRQFLLEERRLQVGSVIFAAEGNPFDLYRTLVLFDLDYQTTLASLGGALVHLSTHGSKLLSIGVLLAAYERDLPVYVARSNRYELDESFYDPGERVGDQLTCVWLAGQPYGDSKSPDMIWDTSQEADQVAKAMPTRSI